MRMLLLLIMSHVACHAAVFPDLAYVPDAGPLQKLDLYTPDRKMEGGAPVLVAIHGGAWAFGDKSNAGFVHPKVDWFNERGFIVASVNYRLSPAVTHPTHIEDVCRSIAWVQKHISKYGGDPKRIYLLGHSAGAHLAALAGVDDKRLKAAGVEAQSIRGVILLDGACYDVSKQIASSLLPRGNNMYTRAFTLDPKIQADASPTLKVADMKGSPPPYLILHVADRASSKAQSHALAAALIAKGGKAQVVAIEDKNHGAINSDLGKPGDATTLAVAKFLDALK